MDRVPLEQLNFESFAGLVKTRFRVWVNDQHLSPAMVAQYETQMIPREVLRQKLHEWSKLLEISGVSEMDSEQL